MDIDVVGVVSSPARMLVSARWNNSHPLIDVAGYLAKIPRSHARTLILSLPIGGHPVVSR